MVEYTRLFKAMEADMAKAFMDENFLLETETARNL